MSLIGLLFFILVCVVIVGLLEYFLRTANPPVPAMWATILRLGVVVVLIIVLVSLLTGGLNTTVFRIN